MTPSGDATPSTLPPLHREACRRCVRGRRGEAPEASPVRPEPCIGRDEAMQASSDMQPRAAAVAARVSATCREHASRSRQGMSKGPPGKTRAARDSQALRRGTGIAHWRCRPRRTFEFRGRRGNHAASLRLAIEAGATNSIIDPMTSALEQEPGAEARNPPNPGRRRCADWQVRAVESGLRIRRRRSIRS